MTSSFEGGLIRHDNEQAAARNRHFSSLKQNILWEGQDAQRYESIPDTLLKLTSTGQQFIGKLQEKRQQEAAAKAARDQWRDPGDRIQIDTDKVASLDEDKKQIYYDGNKAALQAQIDLDLSPDKAELLRMDEGVTKDLKLQKYLKHASDIEYPAWLSEQFTLNNTWLKVDGLDAPFQINDPNLNRSQRAAASEYLTDIYLDKKGIYNLRPGYTNYHGFWDAIKKAESNQMAAGMKLYNTKRQFEREQTATDHLLNIIQTGDEEDKVKAISNYVQVFAAGTKTPGGKSRRSFGDIQQTLWDLASDLNKSDPKGVGKDLSEFLLTGKYRDTDGNLRNFAKRKALANIEENVKESAEQENQDHAAKVEAEKRMGEEYQTKVNEILNNLEPLSTQARADAIDKLGVEYTQKWRQAGLGTGIPGFLGNNFNKTKNTYETDKYQLDLLAKKQGGILFKNQLENRDPTLVNEWNQTRKVKDSLQSYLTGHPAFEKNKGYLKLELGRVFGITALGALKDADGDRMLTEAIEELKIRSLQEGELLSSDPAQAIKNAGSSLLDELKQIKDADEVKNHYLYRRMQGSDFKRIAIREVQDLFRGELKDADLSKPLNIKDKLSSLRKLPDEVKLEMIKTAKGFLPETPFTTSLHKEYLNSLTNGEAKAFGVLTQGELMQVLINEGGVTTEKIELSPAQLEHQKLMKQCQENPTIDQYLKRPWWKVIMNPKDTAAYYQFQGQCKQLKLQGDI
tara:strand:+ start:1003 stop:3219 length:2217 start_codon:yes stop_codon:yes gene_type:complete